jgi:hypothetical protein
VSPSCPRPALHCQQRSGAQVTAAVPGSDHLVVLCNSQTVPSECILPSASPGPGLCKSAGPVNRISSPLFRLLIPDNLGAGRTVLLARASRGRGKDHDNSTNLAASLNRLGGLILRVGSAATFPISSTLAVGTESLTRAQSHDVYTTGLTLDDHAHAMILPQGLQRLYHNDKEDSSSMLSISCSTTAPSGLTTRLIPAARRSR